MQSVEFARGTLLCMNHESSAKFFLRVERIQVRYVVKCQGKTTTTWYSRQGHHHLVLGGQRLVRRTLVHRKIRRDVLPPPGKIHKKTCHNRVGCLDTKSAPNSTPPHNSIDNDNNKIIAADHQGASSPFNPSSNVIERCVGPDRGSRGTVRDVVGGIASVQFADSHEEQRTDGRTTLCALPYLTSLVPRHAAVHRCGRYDHCRHRWRRVFVCVKNIGGGHSTVPWPRNISSVCGVANTFSYGC